MSFVTVTKEQFYAAMGPLNVHPRPEPEITYWEMPNREVVGISKPGWNNPGAEKSYQLAANKVAR